MSVIWIVLRLLAIPLCWLLCWFLGVALAVLLAQTLGDDFGGVLFWGAIGAVFGAGGSCVGVVGAFLIADTIL